MALPRQAAQTAVPGATSALHKPEPEPSLGLEALRILRSFPSCVGITEHGVLMPQAPAAGPSLHPRRPMGPVPMSPGGFGDGDTA